MPAPTKTGSGYLDGIIAATVSLYGLLIDGTGGAIATAQAGLKLTAGAILSTVTRTVTSGLPLSGDTPGQFYGDDAVLAKGWWNESAGSYTFQRGRNIGTFTKNGTGDVTITFTTVGGLSLAYWPKVTLISTSKKVFATCVAGSTQIQIKIYDDGGTATDCAFSFEVGGY